MDKKQKQYLDRVRRRLRMPADAKDRVMADLTAAIEDRREAGQSDEQIYAELGNPRKAAADLNEQLREYTYLPSPWRWFWLAVAALGAGVLFVRLVLPRLVLDQAADIIGGADGPTAIYVTGADAFPWGALLGLALLLAGALGFWRLSRRRR